MPEVSDAKSHQRHIDLGQTIPTTGDQTSALLWNMPRNIRKPPTYFPNSQKDASYWIKRRKNNEAAKKSRDKRRLIEVAKSERLAQLMRLNALMRKELRAIKRTFGLPLDKPFIERDEPFVDDQMQECSTSTPGSESSSRSRSLLYADSSGSYQQYSRCTSALESFGCGFGCHYFAPEASAFPVNPSEPVPGMLPSSGQSRLTMVGPDGDDPASLPFRDLPDMPPPLLPLFPLTQDSDELIYYSTQSTSTSGSRSRYLPTPAPSKWSDPHVASMMMGGDLNGHESETSPRLDLKIALSCYPAEATPSSDSSS